MRRADDGMGDPEAAAGRRAVEDEQQRHLRLRADFDNVRRRAARELEAARRDGQRAALLPLLAVLDSLDRALAAGSTDPDFYEGVAATHRLFINALHEAGADPVESVGRPFDPRVHEAVATAPSNSVEPGTGVSSSRHRGRSPARGGEVPRLL